MLRLFSKADDWVTVNCMKYALVSKRPLIVVSLFEFGEYTLNITGAGKSYVIPFFYQSLSH